ncbi:DUF2971 domain-containing protein [Treponema endosymbiont of Eucomonympha sp.]|uniref:DUF2971 domain-containing protein n=1 Tax=Treponema endosymbiont of Eucomonympha sp. TaxID=1580831 RepID=UPI00078357D8|nr:DUF2971 domain-containing protein [Treponema endosymbiont of Eucomonympha sp.]
MSEIDINKSLYKHCTDKLDCIYKYRPLWDNDKFNLHTINMINKGELHFSFPKDYNDPFDCKIDFYSQKYNLTQIEAYTKLDSYYAPALILCLTKDPLNTLMWSHYADGHSGVCIDFKVYPFAFGNYIKFSLSSFLKAFEEKKSGKPTLTVI